MQTSSCYAARTRRLRNFELFFYHPMTPRPSLGFQRFPTSGLARVRIAFSARARFKFIIFAKEFPLRLRTHARIYHRRRFTVCARVFVHVSVRVYTVTRIRVHYSISRYAVRYNDWQNTHTHTRMTLYTMFMSS